MITHPQAYWRAVAKVIDAEERKVASYLCDEDHRLDLARAAILRKIIAQETPTKFRTGNGLVLFPTGTPPLCSEPVDVLVHEPAAEEPFYDVGPLALVPHNAVRFAIEVVPVLNEQTFVSLLAVNDSLRPFIAHGARVPVFGLGFDGVPFEALVGYVAAAGRANRLKVAPPNRFANWPVCVAVHRQNYVGIRPTAHVLGGTYWFCAFDCDRATRDGTGLAMAEFFRCYYELLAGKQLEGPRFRQWYNDFPVAPEAKVFITPEGQVQQGLIPA